MKEPVLKGFAAPEKVAPAPVVKPQAEAPAKKEEKQGSGLARFFKAITSFLFGSTEKEEEKKEETKKSLVATTANVVTTTVTTNAVVTTTAIRISVSQRAMKQLQNSRIEALNQLRRSRHASLVRIAATSVTVMKQASLLKLKSKV
ncbi:hypothetical protein JCM19233_2636 [Vibrio astriarenae]|nr:hypothetical protein JCM19233_2636 [Vibrio sp. C7]